MINYKEIYFEDTQLRQYQNDAKKKIYTAWQSCSRVMLQMPTGTGKTRLFVSIVRDMHNWGEKNRKAVKTLILAHRQELIEQISENVGYHYKLAHGVIMANYRQQPKLPTQIASVQTLTRRLDDWKDKAFDLIIVDEAHHSTAKTYRNILSSFPQACVLGVTATPYRMNGDGFKKIFDDLIVSPSVAEFIKMGYLCGYEYYSIKPDSKIQGFINDINEFDIDGDYAESALSRIFNRQAIRAKVVDTYKKYANGMRGIVYTINISHNMQLCEEFRKEGIIAEAIDSKTDLTRRKQLVSEFKKGKIQVICNVNIFSEGFDCPDVEFIQLTRPTKSLAMYLQQVGRGFRISEGKKKTIFLDNVGLYNRFGLPSIRRQWMRYFEGQCFYDKEIINTDPIIDSYGKVVYIEEGCEQMLLIETTVNPNEPKFNIVEDFPVVIAFDSNRLKNEIKTYGHDFGDDEFETIVSICSDDPIVSLLSLMGYSVNNDYQKVNINNKWGIYDKTKKSLIIPIDYDEISRPDKLQRSLIQQNGLWGILDCSSWQVTINPQYSSIEKCNISNYFVVEQREKFGVIDIQNKILIPIKYDSIIVTKNSDKFHFNVLSNEGWQIVSDTFEIMLTWTKLKKTFYGDYFLGFYKQTYGLLSKDLKIEAPFIFSEVIESKDSLSPFIVKVGYYWGVLDGETDWLLLPKYDSITVFSDGLFMIKERNLLGLVKNDGTIILPAEFDHIIPIFDNYIVHPPVKCRWQVYDSSGTFTGIEKLRKKDCEVALLEKIIIENPDIKLINPNKKKKKPKKKKEEKVKSSPKPTIVLKNIKQKEKAILLLSIIKLIEQGEIKTSKIYLSDALVRQFNNYFIFYGLKSIRPEFDFGAAFYYLKDEEFWQLIPNVGKSVEVSSAGGNPFSISKMKERFYCAEINQEFYSMLTDVHKRSKLRSFLLTLL